jgi:hypothetical protein
VVRASGMIPASGNAAIGSSAVTSMSTASVIHQVAIHAIIASVARPAWEKATTLPCASVKVSGSAKCSASASTGPRMRPARPTRC